MPKFFEKQTDPNSQPQGEKNLDPVRTHLSWTAPSRPFRKKDRSYYTTIAIIVMLLILISLLAREVILVGVLLAFTFVVYVLAFIAPEDVEYKISTQGITIGDHFYFWGDLDSFWFSPKEGHNIVHVLTHLHFPGQLLLLLGDQSEGEIKNILAKYLPFLEIAPKSLIDKWAESLQKHFPLETPHR
ncbi:MAG: hypothetical protein UU73_C0002G0082 [Candidatus Daviesbacteria bacterium GW2011_GWA1_41_61]|uniref:DUF5673 domain-containing protein n=1 Tax=Candidatus Daviesbacteria bacterium GW2011_GWA2_40_9 TaxID=1618424 RepID=A0A0G0WEV5_9BACT|nr:MAG: hypothetical protein UU29_C0009G0066 [Candidatus Daviesbacteria bacterium GW2011_GWA2_40_9]KKR93742.1 MAG: hypothetical protein UU44_C0001G0082 [Candidatus Daviesbacteria bacterium GW2011_GWB1_41_15]KKS15208.1 MAG: hypothetical protein UU73_C0002G0082 [Candidatus Daviesbacteria bacterium GW2011_GWA1_41_61]